MTILYNTKIRSIDLMDLFEQCNVQHEPLYSNLLLQKIFTDLDDVLYSADILIARKPYEIVVPMGDNS